MNSRTLTGNWYLKKGWFGYTVMVEVSKFTTEDLGIYSSHIEYKTWEKAKGDDLIRLKIKVA